MPGHAALRCNAQAGTRRTRLVVAPLLAAALFAGLAHGQRQNCTVVVERSIENTFAELSCGAAVIASIDFAHYGTPEGPGPGGACNHTAAPACDLDVAWHFTAECVGRHNCTRPATMFAYEKDPCPGAPGKKRTVVKYTCSSPPPEPPAPPLPPPSPPSPPPPPPMPPGSFKCIRLPELAPQPAADAGDGQFADPVHVSFRAIANFSKLAPSFDASDPATSPFDCVPPLCRSSAISREECEKHIADLRLEVGVNEAKRTSCGEDYKGWELDFSDVVIGVMVEQVFFGRIDQQVGMAPDTNPDGISRPSPEPTEPRRKGPTAALDLRGAWWNVTAFRKANLLILDQCTKPQWLHGQPGRCAHTDTVETDIAALRAAGVQNIRYAFWNRTSSTVRADGGDADDRSPDWRTHEADKTRHLMLHMLEWKPEAHFFVKVDTDVILYPERLLRFLRTLEAAIGTEQPAYFGNAVPVTGVGFMQGAAYGFNGAHLRQAKQEGRLSVEFLDGLIRRGIRNEDRVAGWWGVAAYHFHCGQFFPGIGKDYSVRVNRMREAITYHHLLPAMLRPLGLSALDPADICLAPELKALAPKPPPPPPPRGERRRRRVLRDPAGERAWGRGGDELSAGEPERRRGREGELLHEGGRVTADAQPAALARRGGRLLAAGAVGEALGHGGPMRERAQHPLPSSGSLGSDATPSRVADGAEQAALSADALPTLRETGRRLAESIGGEPQPSGAPARPPRNDWFCPELQNGKQVELTDDGVWDLNERR